MQINSLRTMRPPAEKCVYKFKSIRIKMCSILFENQINVLSLNVLGRKKSNENFSKG